MSFLLALVNHKHLGYILIPYMTQRKEKQECYAVLEKATPQHKELNAVQKELVEIIQRYDTQHLYQIYCKNKKKVPLRRFLEETPAETYEQFLRPFIEVLLDKCFKLLQKDPQLVYLKKERETNCYDEHRLSVSPKQYSSVFKFSRNDEGIHYQLSIENNDTPLKLNQPHNAIVCQQPCYLKAGNQICQVTDSDGAKFKPFFKQKYLHIKKDMEEQYINGFVKKCVKNFRVITEGIELKTTSTKPSCTLFLTYDLNHNLTLSPRFNYNGEPYYYKQKNGNSVKVSKKNDTYTITKTPPCPYEEDRIIALLMQMDLEQKDTIYFQPKSNKNEQISIVHWLSMHEKLFKRERIKISQEELDTNYYIGKAEVSIKTEKPENNKVDWFDLEAYVIAGNFKIPFSHFKQHILDKIPEFILPDKSLFVIPESWFEEYNNLMLMSKSNGDKLQLSKFHHHLSDHVIENPVKRAFKIDIKKKTAIPKAIKATLRDYQKEGFNWMTQLTEQNMGGILADDMGLGKTLQTITLLSHFYPNKTNSKQHDTGFQLSLFDTSSVEDNDTFAAQTPSLIIAPTSLVYNWINEIKKFNPRLRIMQHTGYKRGKITQISDDVQVVISSYGVVRNEIEDFKQIPFLCTVLDESHNIKNSRSKAYRAITKLNSEHRIALTGTPVENTLNDLWAQLNFVNPGILGNEAFFEKNFKHPIEKQGNEKVSQTLKRLTAPFLLRRTKQEVVKELPPVSEQTIWCDMTDQQEKIYTKEKSRARHALLDDTDNNNRAQKRMQLLTSLMKLRQIASHPRMVNAHSASDSGKMEEVINILLNLRKEGHKALVFSSFVKHLNIIQERLEAESINYAMLTGQTREREKVVHEFQKNDDQSFFLISLKAGGVGLNLTAASYVLILDPWWNPAAEQQAIGRAHRIGQNKNVMVYHFISKGTIEEKVQLLQERKKQLAGEFTDNNAFNRLSDEELLEIIND